MNKMFFLLLVVFIGKDTKNIMGQNVQNSAMNLLNSFIKEDFNILQECCIISENEFKDFLSKKANPNQNNNTAGVTEETTKKAKQQFDQIIEKGKGFYEWRKAVFKSIEVNDKEGVAGIKIIFSVNDLDAALILSPVLLINNQIKLFSQSEIKFEKPDFTAQIIKKIIVTLQNQDADGFASLCVPSDSNFRKIMTATYWENPEFLQKMNFDEVHKDLMTKKKENFKQIIKMGNENGIDWKDISFKWSGNSSQLTEKIYQLRIPFKFIYNNKSYRIEVDSCNQLPQEQNIILLGEMFWKETNDQ